MYKNKRIPRFDGDSYESWKRKMRTHLICIVINYWLVKNDKTIVKNESNISSCIDEESKIF